MHGSLCKIYPGTQSTFVIIIVIDRVDDPLYYYVLLEQLVVNLT